MSFARLVFMASYELRRSGYTCGFTDFASRRFDLWDNRLMARKPKYSMFGNLRPQDFRALGIGLELSAVIGGFAYGGHWLDDRWGTGPWLLLIGVCIGTLAGGWHAMKMANGGQRPDFGFKPKADKPKADTSDRLAERDKPKS